MLVEDIEVKLLLESLWVAIGTIHHEGSEVLGVFSSMDLAMSACMRDETSKRAEGADLGWPPDRYDVDEWEMNGKLIGGAHRLALTNAWTHWEEE